MRNKCPNCDSDMIQGFLINTQYCKADCDINPISAESYDYYTWGITKKSKGHGKITMITPVWHSKEAAQKQCPNGMGKGYVLVGLSGVLMFSTNNGTIRGTAQGDDIKQHILTI